MKAQIRRYMHVLINQAILWEILERNPNSLVKQSSKRQKTPRVLVPEEFKALVNELAEPYKTMVVTITRLGLRVCELLAVQWVISTLKASRSRFSAASS